MIKQAMKDTLLKQSSVTDFQNVDGDKYGHLAAQKSKSD